MRAPTSSARERSNAALVFWWDEAPGEPVTGAREHAFLMKPIEGCHQGRGCAVAAALLPRVPVTRRRWRGSPRLFHHEGLQDAEGADETEICHSSRSVGLPGSGNRC